MGQSLDLFAAVSPEGAWTVTQVTRRARAVVEAGLLPLWVRGEISGFKAWQSGHWYFALRDRSAQIRCVMFQKDNRRLPAPPQDGMQVFLFARPTVWEDKGEFRLTVVDLLSTEAGGLWQLAFEKTKAALAKDGLLDPARKRPLPPYPLRIGIVTSPDGAALQDIIAATGQRRPVTAKARSRRSAPRSHCCAGSRDWTSPSSVGAAAPARTSGPSTTSASPGRWRRSRCP